MKTNIYICFLICWLASTSSQAKPHNSDLDKDTNLRFDTPVNPDIQALHFNQKEILKPKANDLELIETAPMSNELGERWVLITLRNKASGQRLFQNENIVATFANGEQAYAKDLNETLKARESLTKTVFFGRHRFPIIRLDVGE